MPRVRDVSDNAHFQAVRVTGQIFGAAAGQDVIVTLERQTIWYGQVVPMRITTKLAAGGQFVFDLPASDQLATVDGAPVPHYVMEAPGVHRLRFVVPSGVDTWRLSL